MYNFPFFPHFYPKPYYSYPHNTSMNLNNNTIYNSRNNQESLSRNSNRISKPSNNHHQNSKNSKNDEYDNEIIEILGIKLHQDDILLICLIFFLYQEGVKDEFLFIVLILLLLT